MNIYFAGKIGPEHTWRDEILDGKLYGAQELEATFRHGWFNYCGPFFVDGCNHCDSPQDGSHGNVGEQQTCGCSRSSTPSPWSVTALCHHWLKQADHLFAWIEDATCFGTILEIGWAQEMGIPVFVAYRTARLADDMWLMRHFENTIATVQPDAVMAFAKFTEVYAGECAGFIES